jgi:hypothetical protein
VVATKRFHSRQLTQHCVVLNLERAIKRFSRNADGLQFVVADKFDAVAGRFALTNVFELV